MRASPKSLLALALIGLAGGVFIASSHRNLPLALEVVMPLGAIFTGLFLVSLLLKNEVIKFNDDERLKNEAIKRYRSSVFDPPEKHTEETSNAPVTIKVAERKPEIRHEETVEESVEAWRHEGDPS
jgi:predicted component of type VI protein secretion system